MSQTPDNSNPSNAAIPPPDTSGPTHVWRVNLWPLILSFVLIPNGVMVGMWLLASDPDKSSLPNLLASIALLDVSCWLFSLALPRRWEATRDSLVIVRGIGRATIPRSAIRGVCTRYDPKRPARDLRLRTYQMYPSFRQYFRNPDAIFDTLTSLYGTCECAPEFEPDSPLWKSVADEYAEHAMFRVRYRSARIVELLGIISFLATIAIVIWRDAVFDWLFNPPGAVEPDLVPAVLFALTAMVTMAGVTLVASLGIITILDLVRGGTVREITATRDSLTIRRTLRTTIIPRNQILFVEPSPAAALNTIRVYVRGRAQRPTCKFSIRMGRGADAWRFPAALIWLYGRAPTHTPSTHELPA